jgi:hypothetical protein
MAQHVIESSSDVLSIIETKEHSKKFVWTAGRVLMAASLVSYWVELSPSDRKALLKRVQGLLEELETKGVLERRPIKQGIGFGDEVGFDFLHQINDKGRKLECN